MQAFRAAGDAPQVQQIELTGYVLVLWSYLARLDEIPCDIFVRGRRWPVLYASTGAPPETLRARAREGIPLLVRESDAYLLRRMLTVSLERTLEDRSLRPIDRSREAYAIASSIIAPSFRSVASFSSDEAHLMQDTMDLLTNVLMQEDDLLWGMVASMQRHQVTHNHAIHSAILALSLAKRVGISALDLLRDVGRGALLCDIGLTTIPTRVLQDGEQLDPLAARALRKHPAVGYAIVTQALGETPSYAHVILEHHERVDGSGYPAGRKASQLPLDAQIAGIADEFDALTSGCLGRQPLSTFDACRGMRFAHPGQFADDLLAAFIEMLGGWDGLRAVS